MELCPNCYSDNVERTSSTGLRVVVCIILLFIPFGLLICWVPFAFPHTYRCKHCANEGKEEELLSVDWRERETFIEKEKMLKETIDPLIGKWFERQGNLYTFRMWDEQFILIEVDSYINPSKIIDCQFNELRIDHEPFPIQLLDYKLMEKRYEPTRDSEKLFNEKELSFLVNRNEEQFKQYLEKQNLLIEPYDIVVGKNRMYA